MRKYIYNEQKLKNIRQRHNQQILEKMRQGKSLISYDAFLSWYPPRPIIKKDPQAIKALYTDKLNTKSLNSKRKKTITIKHLTLIK